MRISHDPKNANEGPYHSDFFRKPHSALSGDWRRYTCHTGRNRYDERQDVQSTRPDLIREICVALCHRWRSGRLFVILTANFDESGTHTGSPVTIMAGILGTANQWRQFQRELDKIKAKYGFHTFHSKEFKSRTGEFRGWNRFKCLAMSAEFTELCARSFIRGTVLTINNEEYKRDYVGEGNIRRLRLDTEYGLAFRYCLTDLLTEAVRRFGNHKRFPETRLHVVLESGHRHSGDAKRVFDEMQAEMRKLSSELLASLTFADKRHDPLMVADFLAHTTFMMEIDGTARNPPTVMSRRGLETTTLIHSGFEPGALAVLKTTLMEQLVAKGRRPSGAASAKVS